MLCPKQFQYWVYDSYYILKPVIVCIAKKEHKYIEEFVKYHLHLFTFQTPIIFIKN